MREANAGYRRHEGRPSGGCLGGLLNLIVALRACPVAQFLAVCSSSTFEALCPPLTVFEPIS